MPGAAPGEGAFAPGPAIWVGRREIAHLDRNGRLDVRLTKSVIRGRRDELRADPRFELRRHASDWVTFDIEHGDAADAIALVAHGDAIDDAVALVEAALDANLPTAEPGPPPTGAELERRRRFH